MNKFALSSTGLSSIGMPLECVPDTLFSTQFEPEVAWHQGRSASTVKLSAVDLFCGSGGMSAGFVDAGIDVVAAFDSWSAAVNTYRRNIAKHAVQFDLSRTAEAVMEIAPIRPDIIAGGPPCQDFSSAGRRVEGKRANLTTAFAIIVSECKPPLFLMENVPQARHSCAYMDAKRRLVKVGYSVSEVVLNACLCGVPQARKRFFAFGSLNSDAPERFCRSLEGRIAKQKMTVKEYFGSEIDIEFYYRHPRNYSRRSVFSVHEPSPTVRGVNRPVPPGYKGNHLDRVPPSSVRPLTSQERSRIQTFPASWDWNAGNRNGEAELQIGNAVPVNLASFVALGVLHAARSA